MNIRGHGDVVREMERKVITNFWMKPIPPREFDWCATFEDDEPNDNGQMPHGYGATEAEAIADLLENYEP